MFFTRFLLKPQYYYFLFVIKSTHPKHLLQAIFKAGFEGKFSIHSLEGLINTQTYKSIILIHLLIFECYFIALFFWWSHFGMLSLNREWIFWEFGLKYRLFYTFFWQNSRVNYCSVCFVLFRYFQGQLNHFGLTIWANCLFFRNL